MSNDVLTWSDSDVLCGAFASV